MISQGLVGIVSAYLHASQQDIRKQAALLLGSLASIIRVKGFLEESSYQGLKAMLFDQHIPAREACGWAVNRLASSRLGVELLTHQGIVPAMIESFLRCTAEPSLDTAVFVVYVLEAFSNVFQFDEGITCALGKGLTRRMTALLREYHYDLEFRERINYLCLDSLSKIAQNQQGKEECIQEQVIATTKDYLNSDNELEKKHSLVLIMFCSIDLAGKRQCIYDADGVSRSIIQSLYALLISDDPTIRSNCIETLRSIAQLRDGFLAIASEMGWENKEYLE
jgi:hypothetical protein